MLDNEVEVVEVQPQELMSGLIDVIRETQEKVGYYEMKEMVAEHLDKNSAKALEKKNKHLTEAEIHILAGKLYNRIMTRSSVQALSALSGYYAQARTMSEQELVAEHHKSKRLSRHIRATGES